MPLLGRPDFHQQKAGEGYTLLPGFRGGAWTVVPERLGLRRDEAGRPDFTLEFVTAADPSHPPEPHAVLRFRMQPAFPEAAALDRARRMEARATVAQAVFDEGYIRFLPNTGDHSVPEAVRTPTPVQWNHAGAARFSARFRPDEGELFRRYLEGGIAPIQARAELTLSGVAARAPATITFDPTALHGALFDSSAAVARIELRETLQQQLASLPVTVSRESEVGDRVLAEAFLDRLMRAFMTWTPAPKDDARPHLAIPEAEAMASGRYRWDLSEPRPGRRLFTLQFDPFHLLSEAKERFGLDAFVDAVTVPPLDTGHATVEVGANLPVPRPGVPMAGAHVRVPARPPDRIQEQTKTAEFTPPADQETLRFRFSPGEAPRYQVAPFLIVDADDGVRRVQGNEQERTGERMLLRVSDFPVQFVPVEASQALLEQARVDAVLKWTTSSEGNGAPPADDRSQQVRTLTRDRPRVMFTLPPGAEGQVRFRARPIDANEPTVTSRAVPMQQARVTRSSFSEYGPHTVPIRVQFEGEASVCALELRPAGPHDASQRTVMHFTPDDAEKEWRWMARSLFAPGYQYRRHDAPDGTGWSDPIDPTTPLHVHAAKEEVA